MKIYILLFAFLISLPSAFAATEHLDFDPLTEDVIRTFSNELAGFYEILDQTSDLIKASFKVEEVAPNKVLITNFIMYGQENDSFLAVFHPLQKKGLKIEGPDSDVYLSDIMYDEDFFEEYGFTKLEGDAIPDFLSGKDGQTLYVRDKKISVTITYADGRKENSEI